MCYQSLDDAALRQVPSRHRPIDPLLPLPYAHLPPLPPPPPSPPSPLAAMLDVLLSEQRLGQSEGSCLVSDMVFSSVTLENALKVRVPVDSAPLKPQWFFGLGSFFFFFFFFLVFDNSKELLVL